LILAIARTALTALRRDRASLALSFVLPVAFFSIFAVIFGGQHNTTPRVAVILVDQDQSQVSRQLARALEGESSLAVLTHPKSEKKGVMPVDYTAATAEAAVKNGDAPIALIIPKGFGAHPVSFGPDADSAAAGQHIQMLYDASDTIAPQMVNGLLQKTAMTAMPLAMARQGFAYSEKYLGSLTPEQQKRVEDSLAQLKKEVDANPNGSRSSASGSGFNGILRVQQHAVVGEGKNDSMISFYAAAIGVMFLLFTASGAAGSLLDEAESGALDRVLSSRVTMTTLLAGKLFYNSLLAFAQLTVMFLWGWAVFKLDLFTPLHVAGFVVMGMFSAVAVASFGILLASICHTRAQLGALSTLIILVMSSIGGSMFPRYLMPQSMQTAGLFTINAWAIDGFTKVFWRDLPISALWPQVGMLLAIAIGLFLIARRIARRWEYA
jgi:linearmycin/streptolysin S transport system permease protein